MKGQQDIRRVGCLQSGLLCRAVYHQQLVNAAARDVRAALDGGQAPVIEANGRARISRRATLLGLQCEMGTRTLR